LRDHEVTEARKLDWERISNGALLTLAENGGFDLLVTTDKNVRYQQNLTDRKISIVVDAATPAVMPRNSVQIARQMGDTDQNQGLRDGFVRPTFLR